MQQPGQAHIDTAERLLGWAGAWLDELRDHGRHARAKDAERVLFAALHALAASHDALASAANLSGRRDWCEQLHQAQARDPLLRYLWLALHAEPNHPIVKWAPERATAVTEVVDASKLRHITSLFFSPFSPQGASERLLMYAHGASTREELVHKQGATPPDAARMEAAGVELVHGPEALALQGFEVFWGGRIERVAVPEAHLGVRADFGTAERVLDAGIAHYRAKADELVQARASVQA
ncbi:MAG: hypothetical protein ABL916_19075 [Burkholderiaceae bacterium]